MAKADLRCFVQESLYICPVHNGLQADEDDKQLYPVKIKAIQGHSAASLGKAGGLFATAGQVRCAPSVRPS